MERVAFLPKMFWYEPASGRRRLTLDHGADVMAAPQAYGLDEALSDRMDLAFGDGVEDAGVVDRSWLPDELDPTVAWGADDAWEQVAMNRGWVRVGPYGSGGVSMSAGDTALVRRTLDYVTSNDGRVDKAEFEICERPGTTVVYVDLKRGELATFMAEDDAGAETTVRRVGLRVDRVEAETYGGGAPNP